MEFLVRVVDKGVALDASKAGDLIAACADGWPWSDAELTNPEWRIVSVAGIAQSTVDSLLTVTRATVQGGPFRRRDWSVDFSKLPDPSLFAGARTQAIITLTKQQVQAAIVKKAPL